MMSPLLLLFLACSPPDAEDPTALPVEPYDPLPLVDPFIGTGGVGAGIGAVNPGAARPFGMVIVGPDTRKASGAASFYHCGGYYWPDDRIDGFSHTHAHGMGVPDYGGIHVMPRAGWDPEWTRDASRSAPFDHDAEQASPGYYAVTLQDDGTRVEIAATDRGAIHRITYAETAEPVLVFDLGHALSSMEVPESWVEVDAAAGVVEGYQLLRGSYSGRFGGLRTWFSAEVDPAPVAMGTWATPSEPVAGVDHAEGEQTGAWVVLPEGTEVAHLRLAISYVDLDGAVANRQAELPEVDLDAVLADAEQAWRDELATVRVRGGTEEQRRIFHSALYHTCLWPSLFSDVDGRYRGLDGEVHQADGPYYTDFSLWDTFRTSHPWFVLAHPERARDLARSLVQMAEDGGSMPRWPLGHGYTGGMVGSPADQVLAGTWLKGLEGWDAEAGFDVCYQHSTGPMADAGRAGIEEYVEQGWVYDDQHGGAASLVLEYAWSDHSMALWAESLGRTAEAEVLWGLSESWRNVWDPDQGFFLGRRSDGTFAANPHPTWWNDTFVEGNSWQYLWYVPYDPFAMVDVQHDGDLDAFLERLGYFWEQTYAEEDDINADAWYWHGNEPDLHYPYLGSLVGRHDATADPVRFVMSSRYDDSPDGLDGNEDGGTLSAWYLLSAIGVYPVAGTSVYAVGSPLFERSEIDLEDGRTLVVRAPSVSGANRYVRWAALGGQPLLTSVLTHDELVEGGELVLVMSPSPSGWGDGGPQGL